MKSELKNGQQSVRIAGNKMCIRAVLASSKLAEGQKQFPKISSYLALEDITNQNERNSRENDT